MITIYFKTTPIIIKFLDQCIFPRIMPVSNCLFVVNIHFVRHHTNYAAARGHAAFYRCGRCCCCGELRCFLPMSGTLPLRMTESEQTEPTHTNLSCPISLFLPNHLFFCMWIRFNRLNVVTFFSKILCVTCKFSCILL